MTDSLNQTPDAALFGNGRLTIDLNALVSNWKKLRTLSKSGNLKTTEAGAVIKANAYGLGIEKVVPALTNAGCETFFIATLQEGARVRKLNKSARIYVLNGFHQSAFDFYKKHKLTPILCTPQDIDAFLQVKAKKSEAALHIDTGMNRLGLSAEELAQLLNDEDKMQAFKPCMIMSHFACADDPAHRLNKKQIAAFAMATLKFPEATRSLANSAGIFMGANALYDLTRPGIAMYGGEAVNDVANPMKPVVKLETRILQLRHVKKGGSVGYGAAGKVVRDSIIATCATGYADGYARGASGAGVAMRKVKNTFGAGGMIGPHHVPLIGRVSMDLTAFDATDVPQPTLKKAQWIEMLNKTIQVDDVARSAGTIGYEVLTNLGARYERVYLGE
ncbi:MAG: alanine racemase [Nitratireductor sp.]